MLEKIIALPFDDLLCLVNCGLTLLLLTVAVISAAVAFKEYHSQKERAKKEAACNLARVYADEILKKYTFITDVFKKTDILKFTKDVFPITSLSKFTLNEMCESIIKSGESPEAVKHKMLELDPTSILEVRVLHAESMQERELLYAIESDSKMNAPLQKETLTQISDLLNELEWFSMNCRYGLADEALLYQSLHQTFLSTAWMLYYYICMNNSNNEDKFYTNIIWLFDVWSERLNEQSAKAQQQKQDAIDTIERGKKQLEDAGNECPGKALK